MSDQAIRDSKFKIDFIDPLFAVAIHIGFVGGLMEEPWFKSFIAPTRVIDFANLAMFVAGFWLLVGSWLGYHQSIIKKPIVGNQRFILDIVLLMLYIFLLLYFRNPPSVSVLLVAVFAIYVLWDFHKTIEHRTEYYSGDVPSLFGYIMSCLKGWLCPDNNQSTLTGEIVTVGWTVFFLILLPFSFFLPTSEQWVKLGFALVVILATTLYRLDKGWGGKWIQSIPFKIFMGAALAYIVLYTTRVLCF